ncbi:MAG: pyridoxamine 5'-phosphate oxidase family protein [Planctomycetia bacterium]
MSPDAELGGVLRWLLLGRGVAALATLHEGRPFASMVPFACAVHGGRLRLVTHVSGLAAHTRDMRMEPEVCLLITAAESEGVPPQALPRVSLPGQAEFIAADHPEHAALKAAYLDKFPEAADLFSFADFSLVAIEPTSGRLVAGFARAMTLAPEALVAAVAGGA